MSIHVETVSAPPAGQCFRLLQWRDNLQEVDYCEALGNTTRIHGAGDHWHLHKEMELTWIEHGRGTRVVGDHIAQFSGPELVLLGAQLPHCWHGLKHSSGLALQFYWPLNHPIRALPEFATLQTLWENSGRGLLFGAGTARSVAAAMKEMLTASAPVRLGLLLEILGELAAIPAQQSQQLSHQDFSLSTGARHQPGIQRVIQHALTDYAAPFSMEATLHLAGMSKATFARQFLRFTGLTYTEFLGRVRLDQARQQLFTTDETVSGVAFSVGFNHLSHFNRAYRERFGATPTEDRGRQNASGLRNSSTGQAEAPRPPIPRKSDCD